MNISSLKIYQHFISMYLTTFEQIIEWSDALFITTSDITSCLTTEI